MIIYQSNTEFFKVFKVQSLKNIKGSNIKVGDIAYCELTPNNRYHMSETGQPGTSIIGAIIKSNVIENKHFIRI